MAQERRAANRSSSDAKAFWEPRQRPGGLDDLEAVVRTVQLSNASSRTEVLHAAPAAALAKLAALELLDEVQVKHLIEAHHLLRQIENILAVADDGSLRREAVPAGLKAALASASAVADFGAFEVVLEAAVQRVHTAFDAFVGNG